ncbi:MAG: hypothetical protein U5L11_14695 [Arhodomonas sp.]|nr:hypothetical protein [Arhodomonas sp.]
MAAEVFPGVEFLHIKRHGVDVAQSLRVRHRLASANAIARYQRRQRLYDNNPMAPKRSGFGHAPAMADLEAGLRLADAMLNGRRWHVANLGDGMELALRGCAGADDRLAGPRDRVLRPHTRRETLCSCRSRGSPA